MIKVLQASPNRSFFSFLPSKEFSHCRFKTAETWQVVCQEASRHRILLLDWNLVPHPEALHDLKDLPLRILFIIHPEDWLAVQDFLLSGRHHYVRQPFHPQEVNFQLTRLLEELREEEELDLHKKELELVNHRLEQIIESTREIALTEKVEDVGPLLMKRFAHNMAAEGGSLFLVEREGLKRIFSLDPGHTPDYISFPLDPQSPLREVLQQKTSLLIPDMERSPLASSGWTGYKNRSGLLFPIFDDSGQTAGIITLHNKLGENFTTQDKHLGTLLASYSSEVIQSLHSLKALQRSEELYRQFFDQDITGDFLINLKGEVVLINPAFSHMFELPQPFQSFPFQRILPPGETWEMFKLRVEAKSPVILYDQVMVTWEGRNLNIMGNLIAQNDAAGNLEMIHGFFLDITKRKRLESLLSHSQKMEAIGRMASGVAHDFNNLITAIVGYGELLLDGLQNTQMEADALEILRAGERGAALTKQLLSLGRRDPDAEKRPLVMDEVVLGMSGLFKQMTRGTCKVVFELQSEGAVVMMNPAELEQILMNLVINARDAMPGGGNIRIRSHLVHPWSPDVLLRPELSEGSYVVLKVSDTGEGIPSEVLPYIFEPFYTTKDPGRGTGMGLALVYNGVKSNGGFIEVNSTPEIGTDFLLFFPLSRDPLRSKEQYLHLPPSQDSGNLLLVEEEEGVRNLLVKILSARGYTLLCAADPQEAEALPLEAVDLLITDIQMDGATGAALSQVLSQRFPKMRTIYMSGSPQEITPEKMTAMNIAPQQLLIKPFHPGHLVAMVRRELEGLQ